LKELTVTANVDLKQIERKAWTSYFEDGLWDIFLGLLFLSTALSTLVSALGVPDWQRIPLSLALVAGSILLMWTGKRYITSPRLGRVKFAPSRQSRQRKAIVALAFSVPLVPILLIAATAARRVWPEWPGSELLLPASYAAAMVVIFGSLAYFLEFKRLYLIGVLLALNEPLIFVMERYTALGPLGTFVALAAPASVILIIGLVILTRFMRRYPRGEGV
jgi:hypothetical protein